MGFGFSRAEEARLEQLAKERGAVARRANLPKEPVIEIATRMSWSEKEFQAAVLKLAERRGWLCYHTWLSIRSVPGFPDLVMVRRKFVIWAELKKQKGKESEDQKAWRKALVDAGEHCVLWRPSNWEEIDAVLS